MDPTRALSDQPSQHDHGDIADRELEFGRDMFLYSTTSGFPALVERDPSDEADDPRGRVIGADASAGDAPLPNPNLSRSEEVDLFFSPAVVDADELDLSMSPMFAQPPPGATSAVAKPATVAKPAAVAAMSEQQPPGTHHPRVVGASSSSAYVPSPPVNIQYGDPSEFESEERHSPLDPGVVDTHDASLLRPSPTLHHFSPRPSFLRSASRDSNLGLYSSVSTSPHGLDSRSSSISSSGHRSADRSRSQESIGSANSTHSVHSTRSEPIMSMSGAPRASRMPGGASAFFTPGGFPLAHRPPGGASLASFPPGGASFIPTPGDPMASFPPLSAQVPGGGLHTGSSFASHDPLAASSDFLISVYSHTSTNTLPSASSGPGSLIFTHGGSTPPHRPVSTSPGLSGPLQSLTLRHSNDIEGNRYRGGGPTQEVLRVDEVKMKIERY